MAPTATAAPSWPAIPYAGWRGTCETLRRWTQVVGKIRLGCCPPINHWWHTTLAVTPRGLGTGAMPCGGTTFAIDFDFVGHRLLIALDDGRLAEVRLRPMAVAEFHREVFAALGGLGVALRIDPAPQETSDAIPLDQDRVHADYDAEAVERFHHALTGAAAALWRFRSGFRGKCSPVHFFWGSFDLAVTRFSGRRAPPHPGGVPNLSDRVVREAYSHEVHSVGFWPGGGGR
jgi:hypothetical protein